MRTFTISQFKAHALGIIKGIDQTGEGVIVSKRGSPLVKVLPYSEPDHQAQPGRLAGAIAFEEDIVTPLGVPRTEAKEDRTRR